MNCTSRAVAFTTAKLERKLIEIGKAQYSYKCIQCVSQLDRLTQIIREMPHTLLEVDRMDT